MNSVPSFTVDVETAASLREWLFENAVEKHGESVISEPLAELAAAIDGELHEQAESVELGASARTVPPADQDTSFDDRAPVDDHQTNHTRSSAETDALDTDISDLDRIYDTFLDSAWHLDHDQSVTNQEDLPTRGTHDKETTTSDSHTRRQNYRPKVRYRTSYECSVCGKVHELETSLRVCALIDECVGCGVVARFTAVEIPTPLRES